MGEYSFAGGNWVRVLSTETFYEAQIAREILANEGIESIILNKRDSVLQFGDIEILVKNNNIILAKHLLKDFMD